MNGMGNGKEGRREANEGQLEEEKRRWKGGGRKKKANGEN